jgi:hypothetical protein
MGLFVIFNNMTKKQIKAKSRLKMGKKTRNQMQKKGVHMKKS